MTKTTIEIVNRIKPVLREHGVKKAILFGSYAKGTARKDSDVDLLVDSGLHGFAFMMLVDEVRHAIDDKDVDMFDVTHIDKGSPFDKEIEHTGVLIYEE